MGQSIAVMNTKGGVGKSTVTMALAETLSCHHGRNVLVIDSDSQTSISIMLTSMARWEAAEANQKTLVEYLAARVLHGRPWKCGPAGSAAGAPTGEAAFSSTRRAPSLPTGSRATSTRASL